MLAFFSTLFLSLITCSDFSLVDGHCFKAFIVGKTNTLNYYQGMNLTETTPVNVSG